LQLATLAPAMQIAGMAVADGEGDPSPQSARWGRAHPAGRQGQVYYDEAGKRLFDKINCRQSRPRHGGRRGAASEGSEVAAGNEEEKEKKGEHSLDVPGHGHEAPLAARLLQSAHRKLTESEHGFDDACAGGSAQAFEKARSGQGNQS
jgi:hypothetical protein